MVLLLGIAGIARSFARASARGMGDKYSLEAIITLCILIGGLFGWLGFYIYAALVNWTGKWLKAEGNTGSLFRIFAYASIPAAISLLFLIPQIAIFGNGLFKAGRDTSGAGLLLSIIGYGAMAAEFILEIFAIGFFVIATSEVQKLSVGKSILNLVLPALIIAVPVLVIILLLRI
jgi:hypothetical protein